MIKLFRRFRYWLQRSRMDAELAEEMQYHRALMTRDGGSGVGMGNTTLAREDARAVWIWPWLESFWQDVAYGLRTLRREPGFTITALVALGSAIGINTSLFTIFNAQHPTHPVDGSRIRRTERHRARDGNPVGRPSGLRDRQ